MPEAVWTDSKVHGANMGPAWVMSAPDGPHVGPMNLAIRDTPTQKFHKVIWHLATHEVVTPSRLYIQLTNNQRQRSRSKCHTYKTDANTLPIKIV